MKTYVIFNGDEGSIATYMVINAIRRKLKKFPGDPNDLKLISGAKEDLKLWRFLPKDTENAIIYSLDIALSKNVNYVEEFLKRNNLVIYIDHHNPGKIIPDHKNLELLLADDKKHNTSTFVNELCGEIFDLWAAAGAAGDNKKRKFEEIIERNHLGNLERKMLWRLGKFINSHSFRSKDGTTAIEIVKDFLNYESPFDFIKSSGKYGSIARMYLSDLKYIRTNKEVIYQDKDLLIIQFPIGESSNRMFAGLSYEFYESNKNKVVFCLFPASITKEGVYYTVSIRASSDAHKIAEKLGGGGRDEAAGASYFLNRGEDIRTLITKIKGAVESVKSS